MIEELTEEQKALAVEVAKEWKSKLGNIKINKEDVTEGLEYLYSTINKPLPPIIWVSSPLAMHSTYQSIKAFVGTESFERAFRVFEFVWHSMKSHVWGSIKKYVWDPVENYVWSSVKTSVDLYLIPVDRRQNQSTKSIQSVNLWGWMAWFDYYQRIGIKYGREEDIEKILKLQSAYEYIFCENVVIVCEQPMYSPKRIGEGRLHSDGSAAIEWEDGYKLWYLNGVEVPQYLAETPAGKLDLEWYLQEKNADVKAQFILKYGIDRMSGLGKVIDSYKNYEEINEYWKKSEYELIDMAPIHTGMKKALYLKMKNQTVDGVYHLEGVNNGCNTIYDAIRCRWNGIDPSNYVTINIK